MNAIPGKSNPASSCSRHLRTCGVKLIWLVLVGLLLGCCYQGAIPRLYRPETKAGCWLGAAHGFLMPVALPNLLAGQDVPIFAANNTGRGYKLGYIAGINLCGLIFFGLAFRSKKEEKPAAITSSPQHIQLRNTSITSTRPPGQ
jgi:hypothetical protein